MRLLLDTHTLLWLLEGNSQLSATATALLIDPTNELLMSSLQFAVSSPPGLGELVEGRPIAVLIHFILAAALWLIWMGWIMHLWSTLDAARFKPKFR